MIPELWLWMCEVGIEVDWINSIERGVIKATESKS